MKEQTKPFVGVLRSPRGPGPPCTRPPIPPHLQCLGPSLGSPDPLPCPGGLNPLPSGPSLGPSPYPLRLCGAFLVPS